MAMVKEYSDYSAFVKIMEGNGWYREQLSIDENNTVMVTTYNVAAATTSGRVIEVKCPAGRIITTKGVEQIPAGADRGSAHALILRLAGTDDDETEINMRTKVNIQKITPSEDLTPIARDFYSMFTLTRQTGSNPQHKSDNEVYRWRRGVVLYGEELLKIFVLNPNLYVGTVTMQMDLDLWTRRA